MSAGNIGSNLYCICLTCPLKCLYFIFTTITQENSCGFRCLDLQKFYSRINENRLRKEVKHWHRVKSCSRQCLKVSQLNSVFLHVIISSHVDPRLTACVLDSTRYKIPQSCLIHFSQG